MSERTYTEEEYKKGIKDYQEKYLESQYKLSNIREKLKEEVPKVIHFTKTGLAPFTEELNLICMRETGKNAKDIDDKDIKMEYSNEAFETVINRKIDEVFETFEKDREEK